MKNFRWCCKKGNSNGCIAHSNKEGCCNWVCACQHRNGIHKKLPNSKCAYFRCKCRKFKFMSNDNCLIECQFQYKIYEPKPTKKTARKSKSRA